jgi:hypothetical protein
MGTRPGEIYQSQPRLVRYCGIQHSAHLKNGFKGNSIDICAAQSMRVMARKMVDTTIQVVHASSIVLLKGLHATLVSPPLVNRTGCNRNGGVIWEIPEAIWQGSEKVGTMNICIGIPNHLCWRLRDIFDVSAKTIDVE